jgi:C1A family cysteine protease
MSNLRLGWVRDLPDFRDFTLQSESTSALKTSLGQEPLSSLSKKAGLTRTTTLPKTVDLKQFCSPVEDQGDLGSCTACAAMGLLEYFERRANGKFIDGSRLFLYKTTRNLMQVTGDTGAYMRSVMGALTLFGVPPESFYPYDILKFDEEPSAFLYSFAQNFQAISYYRVDTPGITNANLLTQVKTNLSRGYPLMFGFTVFSSYVQSVGNGGGIPFPNRGDRIEGGHAVCAVGYDDTRQVTNRLVSGPSSTTTGALLIRNSWGTGWGQGGYGWLPYQYILSGLTADCWSLIKAEWVDSGQFA